MRQDLHVLHATDNSIKCRYFNFLPSLSPSLCVSSDVGCDKMHVACRSMLHVDAFIAIKHSF